MNSGRSSHPRTVLGSLALLVVSSVYAQAPKPPEFRTVPLVTDSCPSVRIGDRVSLDWNPNFEPIWPVTGLSGFGLTFAAVADDGVHLKQTGLILDSRYTPSEISPLGNGFFHIEITMRPRSMTTRNIRPGTYRLVKARAIAALDPSYTGGSPQMTSSPVEERYCITVVGLSSSLTSKLGE
jgi:hypothetical protein